jgi:hypothetical protein
MGHPVGKKRADGTSLSHRGGRLLLHLPSHSAHRLAHRDTFQNTPAPTASHSLLQRGGLFHCSFSFFSGHAHPSPTPLPTPVLFLTWHRCNHAHSTHTQVSLHTPGYGSHLLTHCVGDAEIPGINVESRMSPSLHPSTVLSLYTVQGRGNRRDMQGSKLEV